MGLNRKKMIYNNALVNKVPCTFVEFGSGDIAVVHGKIAECPMLILKNIEQHKISEPVTKIIGSCIEETKPEVVIKFDRIESLDVVIHNLMQLRNEFSD